MYSINALSDHVEFSKISNTGNVEWSNSYTSPTNNVSTNYLLIDSTGIYVTFYNSNKIYCKRLDIDTGNEIWGREFDSTVYTNRYCSSVAVGGDFVYCSYVDGGSNAVFQKLNLTDGSTVWSKSYSGASPIYTSVAVDSTGLYVAYRHTPANNRITIQKLDLEDNSKVLWDFPNINQSPWANQLVVNEKYLWYVHTNNQNQTWIGGLDKYTGYLNSSCMESLNLSSINPYVDCDDLYCYMAFRQNNKSTIKKYTVNEAGITISVWTKDFTGNTYDNLRPLLIDNMVYIPNSESNGIVIREVSKITRDVTIDGLLPKSISNTQLGTSNKYFGNCYATAWNTVSDSALKENFTEIQDAVNKINLMDVKQYNLKGQNNQTYGVIADSEDNDPLVINKPDNGYYSVNMYSLLSLTAKAIQDLYKKLKVLELKVK